MAAFEKTGSATQFRAHESETLLDFRTAVLPGRTSLLHTPPDPNEYNPLDYRKPTLPIPVWMAYFNMIRAAFGAGMLAFPIAMSRSGLFLGPVLGLLTAALVMHMHLVLLECLNEISKRLRVPIISYRYGFRIAMLHGPEIAQFFGRQGPTIIAGFMIMSQLGICAVFIDFTADGLRDIMDWQTTRGSILVLFLPYLLLVFLMKNLRIVSYISLFGNLLNVAGLIIMLYHSCLTPHGEFISHQLQAFPLTFSFGSFLFNTSAVGVILALDRSLPDPTALTKRFGVITLGMGIPAIISNAFGVLGYYAFGAMEENVLRSLPYDEISSVVAAGLYTTAVAFAYPIQCYPAILILLEVVKNHNINKPPSASTLNVVEKIAGPAFVTTTFLISYMLPFQALFVAFVGNLCTSMLSLVFPALMELCLLYPGPYGKYKFYLIKDVFIIILGMVSWIFGAALNGYCLYISVAALTSPNNEEFV